MPEPVVCAGCACFCDDILPAPPSFGNACPLGERYLREERPPGARALLPEGREAPLEEAARRAAAMLLEARAPALAGLAGLTIEAQREAVKLAESLQALLLPHPAEPEGARRSGLQAPDLTRSLGEVRGRADLVVFWRCDPLRTHLERYSLDPPLLEREGGPRERRLVLIGGPRAREDLTAGRAHRVIALPGEAPGPPDLDLARSLRAIRERKAAPGGEARELWDLLSRARNAHLFLGEEAAALPALWDQLQLLASRAPAPPRIALSTLGGWGNLRGAKEVLTWTCGLAGPLDFAGGAPRPLAAGVSLERLLLDGRIDFLLALGLDPSSLSPAAASAYRAAPRAVLGPRQDPGALLSFLVPGLDPRVQGRVMRPDGIVLWLSGGPESGVPDPAAEVLRSVGRALAASGAPPRGGAA
jgi:formylmethanofuran dehydrogenase subunit B